MDDLSLLRHLCAFCGLTGAGDQCRLDWKTSQVCRVCYRVANAAWKTYSLRKLLELFERDQKMHQKFLALRTNWVQAKTTGSSRVRLPAASVSRANTVERVVEEAPYRRVRSEDPLVSGVCRVPVSCVLIVCKMHGAQPGNSQECSNPTT